MLENHLKCSTELSSHASHLEQLETTTSKALADISALEQTTVSHQKQLDQLTQFTLDSVRQVKMMQESKVDMTAFQKTSSSLSDRLDHQIRALQDMLSRHKLLENFVHVY